MSLLPFFRWSQATWIGAAIRSSTYWFPAIEVIHLLGLVLLLGPILVVDLRLLGFGMQRQKSSLVAKGVAPLIWMGIGTMVTTGTLLFLSEALKCYENPAFWFKMYFLAGALAFQLTIHRWVTFLDSFSPAIKRLTALLSLALWFGVAVGGRLIAFL